MGSSADRRPVSTRRAVLAGVAASTLLAAVGSPALAAGADPGAEAFINRLGQKSVAILKDSSTDKRQKVANLKDLLNRSTDIPTVGRIIMGQHWREAADAQRKEYLRLFDALVLQTMAERIDSYAGQTFDVTGSQKLDDTDTKVTTKISQPSGGPSYNVDWRVRKTHGRHQVVDIVAENVSLVVTQRSEVNDLVNRSGIDGLLAEMRRRIEQRNPTGQAQKG